MPVSAEDVPETYDTLTVHGEGAVLFVEIRNPPMNLLGPELVRDLVSLIQRAEADDTVQVLVFKSANPDYFISHVDLTRISEYRTEAALPERTRARQHRPDRRPRTRRRQRVRARLRHTLRGARISDFRPV